MIVRINQDRIDAHLLEDGVQGRFVIREAQVSAYRDESGSVVPGLVRVQGKQDVVELLSPLLSEAAQDDLLARYPSWPTEELPTPWYCRLFGALATTKSPVYGWVIVDSRTVDVVVPADAVCFSLTKE